MVPVFLHNGESGPGFVPDLFAQHFDKVHVVKTFAGESPMGEVEQWKAMVVLGGPESILDIGKYRYLIEEVLWMRKALRARVPVLGICLGGQMLSYAQGFPVQRSPWKELGMTPLKTHVPAHPLMKNIDPQWEMMQWHEDAFIAPFDPICSTEGCHFQLVDWGNGNVSTQFHPELSEKDFNTWTEQMIHPRHHLKQTKLMPPNPKDYGDYRKNGEKFFENYISMIKSGSNV